MFDDIDQNKKTSENKKEDKPSSTISNIQNNDEKKEKVEDIYAEVDKGPIPSGLPNKKAEIALNMSSNLSKENNEPKISRGGSKKFLVLGGLIIVLLVLIGGGYFLINNLMAPKSNEAEITETPDLNKDSDNDALTDLEEKSLGTNPNSIDTDKDGLSDNEEVRVFLTDPLLKDTDGDGYNDGEEILNSTDPLTAEVKNISTNSKENATSSKIIKIEENLDADKDGLSDEEEREYGTNVMSVDTDGDGLTDYQEIMIYLSDPLLKDTDGDGYNDGEEVENGYNPLGAGKLNF